MGGLRGQAEVPIRLAHVGSSDLGIRDWAAFNAPLLRRGWEITFICPDGEHARAAAGYGVRHLPLGLERRINLVGDARGAMQLVGHLRDHRFEIVHTHNIKTGLVGRALATLVRTPIVVHTMHGLAYSLETPRLARALHATLERIASLGVDAILAQSEEDLLTARSTHILPPDRLVWVGNGIDLTRFRPEVHSPAERAATRSELGVGVDEVLLLSAGRLVREKGFLELFQAMEIAAHADPRVRLAVAGPRDEAKADALDPDVLRQAGDAGVLLLGERRDMPRLYAAADVVVLVSWREGIPRVLMEGAAMGKPLIASNARGCREVVRPPANGILVAPRDAAALARAVTTLASDPDARTRLGNGNALEARARWDVDQAAARVVAVYDRLLAARTGA